MIVFKRDLKERLYKKGITYATCKEYKIFSIGAFKELLTNPSYNAKLETVNKLCVLLECDITDVIEFIETSEDREMVI